MQRAGVQPGNSNFDSFIGKLDLIESCQAPYGRTPTSPRGGREDEQKHLGLRANQIIFNFENGSLSPLLLGGVGEGATARSLPLLEFILSSYFNRIGACPCPRKH